MKYFVSLLRPIILIVTLINSSIFSVVLPAASPNENPIVRFLKDQYSAPVLRNDQVYNLYPYYLSFFEHQFPKIMGARSLKEIQSTLNDTYSERYRNLQSYVETISRGITSEDNDKLVSASLDLVKVLNALVNSDKTYSPGELEELFENLSGVFVNLKELLSNNLDTYGKDTYHQLVVIVHGKQGLGRPSLGRLLVLVYELKKHFLPKSDFIHKLSSDGLFIRMVVGLMCMESLFLAWAEKFSSKKRTGRLSPRGNKRSLPSVDTGLPPAKRRKISEEEEFDSSLGSSGSPLPVYSQDTDSDRATPSYTDSQETVNSDGDDLPLIPDQTYKES